MKSVHKSVLLNEIVSEFGKWKEKNPNKSPVYLDGTLGGCGHALEIAKLFDGKLTIIGFDQDPNAILRASELLKGKAERIFIERANFRHLNSVLDKCGIGTIDLFLIDLGLSSDELETSGRGFSFQKDEPLYMTFGDPKDHPFTAKDIVNGWNEDDIANVIFAYGDERFAKRIAKKIVEYRQKKKIETSMELAEIVCMAMPAFVNKARRIAEERHWVKKPIHPATRTFQALRIAVNDELGSLKEGLRNGFEKLNMGGVMTAISFHSLEDKIVKDFYRSVAKKGEVEVSKKPITATEDEKTDNPRARSAKLRVLEKIN